MKSQPFIKKGGNKMTYKVIFQLKPFLFYHSNTKLLSVSKVNGVPSGGQGPTFRLRAVTKSSCLFFSEVIWNSDFSFSSALFL